uniref:Uncharacterized protein n=1 Tax=mine drainage metagenome TaxID=410659 RepID=E6QWP0_9ZZZZ
MRHFTASTICSIFLCRWTQSVGCGIELGIGTGGDIKPDEELSWSTIGAKATRQSLRPDTGLVGEGGKVWKIQSRTEYSPKNFRPLRFVRRLRGILI